MGQELKQSESEDLSAWFDGELTDKRKGEVERLVATDPVWTQGHNQLISLHELLDSCTIPADRRAAISAAPADLAEGIIRNVRHTVRSRRLVIRIGVAAGAAAAIAAAILVAVLLSERVTSSERVTLPHPLANPRAEVVARQLKDVPAEDRFVVENLDFFEDYDVLENYESLEAIDRLESQPKGT